MADSEAASIFPQNNTRRLPDDTVSFSIYPDSPLSTTDLQTLHLQILHTLSPYTQDYIWQHQPFSLSISTGPPISHLHGKLRYGDNLDDEWFVVFLLFQLSRAFPNLSIRVFDTDGEFLLIEAAFHLPRWLNPDTSFNRVFIRAGGIHIIPNSVNPSTLLDSLHYLINNVDKTRAGESVQLSIMNRIKDYPDKAKRNMHRVRVRVPVLVAQVLKHEPCLISLAVEGFYDRDIDSMKYAANMEKFLPGKSSEEVVEVSVVMSRAMYGQLVQQTFQAPKGYPMPGRGEVGYVEAELGMKIACGFEMIYQMRKRDGLDGRGSTWEAFRESLEKSGYFEGMLAGSKQYRRLMGNAEQYYKKSSLHSRARYVSKFPI